MNSHLVHVGVHKTGSTWLQQDVFPLVTGLRYVNGDASLAPLLTELLAPALDEDAFRATVGRSGSRLLFSNEGLSGTLWAAGDSGVQYARRIARTLPDAHVLLFVRNQPEMLVSVYAQYVNEGGVASFETFVAGRTEGPHFELETLEFDRLVLAYHDVLGADRTWVVPYEKLRADPSAFFAAFAERYDVTVGIPPARRRNVSLSPAGLVVLRTWNRLFRESRFQAHPSVRALPWGRSVRSLVQRRIDPLLRRVSHPSVPTAAHEVATRYAASNKRLSGLVGEDLRELGYP